ncbi:hypothetical protein [Tenacibaculum soleae]|uniref:hypothetical protein n=1 Tax=Tenacibaculum soleae TaxID=447689 RepID=UPI002300B82F|nr:hypothetical protein [Tenacibaculum soleae]
MKTHTISTFLRPAIITDIFDKNGIGSLKYNKEIFYKEKNGLFTGPFKIENNTSRFLFADFTRQEYLQYLEMYELLHQKKIYVADPLSKEKGCKVHLKLNQATRANILFGDDLIINAAYYIKYENSMEGPLYIKPTNTVSDFYNIVKEKRMFCLKEITKICKPKNKV